MFLAVVLISSISFHYIQDQSYQKRKQDITSSGLRVSNSSSAVNRCSLATSHSLQEAPTCAHDSSAAGASPERRARPYKARRFTTSAEGCSPGSHSCICLWVSARRRRRPSLRSGSRAWRTSDSLRSAAPPDSYSPFISILQQYI